SLRFTALASSAVSQPRVEIETIAWPKLIALPIDFELDDAAQDENDLFPCMFKVDLFEDLLREGEDKRRHLSMGRARDQRLVVVAERRPASHDRSALLGPHQRHTDIGLNFLARRIGVQQGRKIGTQRMCNLRQSSDRRDLTPGFHLRKVSFGQADFLGERFERAILALAQFLDALSQRFPRLLNYFTLQDLDVHLSSSGIVSCPFTSERPKKPSGLHC